MLASYLIEKKGEKQPREKPKKAEPIPIEKAKRIQGRGEKRKTKGNEGTSRLLYLAGEKDVGGEIGKTTPSIGKEATEERGP